MGLKGLVWSPLAPERSAQGVKTREYVALQTALVIHKEIESVDFRLAGGKAGYGRVACDHGLQLRRRTEQLRCKGYRQGVRVAWQYNENRIACGVSRPYGN